MTELQAFMRWPWSQGLAFRCPWSGYNSRAQTLHGVGRRLAVLVPRQCNSSFLWAQQQLEPPLQESAAFLLINSVPKAASVFLKQASIVYANEHYRILH